MDQKQQEEVIIDKKDKATEEEKVNTIFEDDSSPKDQKSPIKVVEEVTETKLASPVKAAAKDEE